MILSLFLPSLNVSNYHIADSMSKFKTKIIQCFDSGFEYYKLLLPDGRCVASGSLDHCLKEREHYEYSLNPVQLSFSF